MSYKLIVEFERDINDDAGAIGVEMPTPKQLAEQLAKELQEAYDELAIAGHFQVKEVQLHEHRYAFDGERDFIQVR